ncbi:MAG: ATP-binding protein [Bacteroidetes bacterium]|nr:ATP-binding protein [Bacteroidota bacterium]
MSWQFTYITWIYVVTAVVCLQLLFFVYNMQKIKGRTEFQWLMLLAAFWSFVLIFESAAPSISTKVIWSQFEYFANMGIPLLFLRFILTYDIDRSTWLKRYYWFFWIIPVVTIIFVFTNRFHHLIWTGFSWSPAGHNILVYHHGAGFFVGMAFSLGLIIFSEILLIRIVSKRKDYFKSKPKYLFTASMVPLLTATLYTLGLNPLEGLNIAPMGMLFFGLIFLSGSARENLFDLIPFSHQLMIEKMGDGVIVLDKYGNILDISPPALTLLKLDHQPVGKQVGEVLPYLNQVVDSATDSDELRIEILLVNPDPVWIETYRFPLRDSKGGFLGNLLMLHDISNRKKSEVQLKKLADELTELNSMKDRLYSVIGHDLRSPFNAILGFSQLLADSYDEFSETERKQFALNINMVASNTYDLLVNLLEWSSTQVGKTTFSPEPINLHYLIDNTFQLLQFNALGKGIKLINSVAPEMMITADRNMFLAIIRNLVSNGIKFSSNKSSVEVLALERGNMVDIIVADTGIGLTAQMTEQLFHIETLITTKGTADEKGTGLGLILSKDFVERHGGKIRVMSEPGLGSRFIITIPVKPVQT